MSSLAAASVGVTGCAVKPAGAPTSSGAPVPGSTTSKPGTSTSSATASETTTQPPLDGQPNVKLGEPIGDGSQAPSPDPQPFQRQITKLKSGEKPPQFVVFSWDGASGNDDAILAYVKAAHALGGTQTMFLTSIYCLPQSKRTLYKPPGRKPGAVNIPFMSDKTVRKTIVDTSIAWKFGNEIGTHFGGHFDATKWSEADWKQEWDSCLDLVTHWRTNTGWDDLEPFPFDYAKECVGSRTPLLAGRKTLLPVVSKLGWRYDSSGVRGKAAWPKKDKYGMYDISMYSVPFRNKMSLPMDYNYLVAQAGGKTNAGGAAERATWKREHADSLRAGLDLVLRGNRAPYIMGNHLSPWLGGIYQENLLELMTEFGKHQDVQLVSFRWLCDWMDAQDPDVLQGLQEA